MLTDYDQDRPQSLMRVAMEHYADWHGVELTAVNSEAQRRLDRGAELAGRTLPAAVRAVLSLGASLDAIGRTGELLGAQMVLERPAGEDLLAILRSGDPSLPEDEDGQGDAIWWCIRLDEMGERDPQVRPYGMEHGDLAYQMGFGASTTSFFMLCWLARHTPGDSVIGYVERDVRYGFLQRLQDTFGIPLEIDGSQVFQNEELIVMVTWSGIVQAFEVLFVSRNRPLDEVVPEDILHQALT